MKKIIYILLLMQTGFFSAQTKQVVTVHGEKVTIHPNANNGLTPNNGNIQFGGSLIQPTTLTTSSLNTLKINGLQAGSFTDTHIVIDENGIVKKATPLSMWYLNGNAGTIAGANFLGTTDDVDLVFKRNSTQAGILAKTNTGFGVNALLNPSAVNSVAIGAEAMKYGTGNSNIAIGYNTMGKSTGFANIAIGEGALAVTTNGHTNIGIGFNALLNNTTGAQNTAVGYVALLNNLTSQRNTTVGHSSMANYTGTEGQNSALGHYSFLKLASGGSNVATGYLAGQYYGGVPSYDLTTANNSVFVGAESGPKANAETNQIVIGFRAVGRGSNTVQIGNSSITNIGGQVAWSNPSDVRLKKDINDSPFGLNFINKLRPVTYHMKTGTKDLQTGFIAQEVEKAANSLNYEFSGIVKPQTGADFYSLRYSDFVVPLVKSVQEQQYQIESQAKQIENQQAKLSANELELKELKERMQKLEKLVSIRIDSN